MYRLRREKLAAGAIRRLVHLMTGRGRAAIGERPEATRRLPGAGLAACLALLGLGAMLPGRAWGAEVILKRRVRSGQKTVYVTKVHTQAAIHCDPPELLDLFPPLPTHLTMQEQNTVTVKAIHSDGSVDLEDHFDQFEFQSNLADRVPANFRDAALKTQQEVNEQVAGQDILARFDRDDRLRWFKGEKDFFQKLDLAYREPFRQALMFFLEQVGGDTLYPDHPVKPGATWKRKLDWAPSAAYPYNVEGENTLRYVGETEVGGVKAAVVEFSFVDVLRPAPEALEKAEPLAQLAAHSLGVDMRIDGQGQGRVLLALDNGRILEDHATLHQTLRAHFDSPTQFPFTKAKSLNLDVQSDSQVDLEGVGR